MLRRIHVLTANRYRKRDRTFIKGMLRPVAPGGKKGGGPLVSRIFA